MLSGREQKDFFGDVADGFATLIGGSDHDVLEPGSYSSAVELPVPANARPSFKGQNCRVFSELSVLLDIPVWRDVNALESFSVGRAQTPSAPQTQSAGTRYPEDEERDLFDSIFSPDLRVEAGIAESVLRTGDLTEGMLVVETPKQLPYRAIKARLISVESSAANGHNNSYTHLKEAKMIDGEGVIDGRFAQEFQSRVTAPGPKSDQGENFRIECFLQIELDVPWAKAPQIRIPVNLL